MKKYMRKAAFAALAGALCISSSLTACGKEENKEEEAVETLDVNEIVATVEESQIPLGVLSFMAHYQQMQTEAMYQSMLGTSASGMWDEVADEETGETYGEQSVREILSQLEMMYLIKENAPDYDVSLTDEDMEKIQEAAQAFAEANSEEVLAQLGTSEESIQELLELATYQERMHDPIVADIDREVSDEEAQQTTVTYVEVSTVAADDEEELTEDEKTAKKDEAQKVLDKIKEDAEADMDAAAKEVNEELAAYDISYPSNNEDDETIPKVVKDALEGLEDGELAQEVVEAEDGYYVVRLDQRFDEDATEQERESIITQRENDKYTEVTEGWLMDAKVEVDESVMKKIKITSDHIFTIQVPETTQAPEETPEVTEGAQEDEDTQDTPEATEAAQEPEETPEVTEAGQATPQAEQEDAEDKAGDKAQAEETPKVTPKETEKPEE